jgi:hypothetical protein
MSQKVVVCLECGAPLFPDMQFCEQCGTAVASPVPKSPKPKATGEDYLMEWVATLSILQNKVVVRQLGYVFFIPLIVLGIILTLIIWPSDAQEWGFVGQIVLITAAVFLGLLLVAILLVYGGKYEYQFRLNEKGIGGRPYGLTAKKNKVTNFLLMFSGQPTAVGTGMLAEARQIEYVAWKDVDTVITDEKHKTLTLHKGKRPLMVVPCDAEQFPAIQQFAQDAATRTQKRQSKKKK